MEIQIHQTYHLFRAYSELIDENHGQYIEATIKVPENCPDFKLLLYSVCKSGVEHTNLLFISPLYGQKIKVDPTPDSCCVNFIYNPENHDYHVELQNHPYLKIDHLVRGPNFWNPETKKILLGKGGLQLTVLKAIRKGGDKSPIAEQKMKESKDIPKEFKVEHSKVCLGIKMDGSDDVFYSSEILYDKGTYDFNVERISLSCINPEERLYDVNVLLKNVNLTKKFTPKLSIVYSNEIIFSEIMHRGPKMIIFSIKIPSTVPSPSETHIEIVANEDQRIVFKKKFELLKSYDQYFIQHSRLKFEKCIMF